MERALAAGFLARGELSEEASWLAAARRGETWALEQLYDQHQGRIYALCYRLLRRPEDARDAVQAAFVSAFRELPRYRGDGNVRTWLYRIAVNEALSMLRKRRDSSALAEESALTADGAPSVVERLAVRDALERVRPAHRAILVLRYWEGLSYEEIAEVLGISLPAMKMRLKRARDEFRSCYEGER